MQNQFQKKKMALDYDLRCSAHTIIKQCKQINCILPNRYKNEWMSKQQKRIKDATKQINPWMTIYKTLN